MCINQATKAWEHRTMREKECKIRRKEGRVWDTVLWTCHSYYMLLHEFITVCVPVQDQEFKVLALEVERRPAGRALIALPCRWWDSFPSSHHVAYNQMLFQSHGTWSPLLASTSRACTLYICRQNTHALKIPAGESGKGSGYFTLSWGANDSWWLLREWNYK